MEILENVRRQLENIQKFRKLDKLKRVVQKDGTTSVLYKNISKKRRRYFYDFYTTLLDSSWSYCVLMFASSFYGSWIFFAILYYTICYLHGDLELENYGNKDWTPCINNIGEFLLKSQMFKPQTLYLQMASAPVSSTLWRRSTPSDTGRGRPRPSARRP